ncbi:MAG: DUF2809 domain-containing protein [bacterium]
MIPLGFFSKFYIGPFHRWFNFYFGGLLYEVFWCLIIALLVPKVSTINIVLSVLFITCGLEFLQLFHYPFLENIRSTFWGRTLIGHSFSWYDFPYYFIGCGLGYVILIKLNKK